MKLCAVIAEYNPFHKGHAAHLQACREAGASHIVAVMSGNFVQRGDVALLEKRLRCRAALLGGADLVLGLPLPYACATAERFAYGGVLLVEALGCVDMLSFGSECGRVAPLQNLARLLESPALTQLLRTHLQEGQTFAKARQQAVADLAGQQDAKLLKSPNNILGVEYLRRLQLLGSSIEPHTLARLGSGHDSQQAAQGIASASLVRQLLEQGQTRQALDYLPTAGAQIVHQALQDGLAPATLQRLEAAILAVLRTKSREQLAALPDIAEGLEHRLQAAIAVSTSLQELLECLKTKRYTLARLRRLVLYAFLGVEAALCRRPPPYLHVLGFNQRGREVLAKAAKTASLPLSHSLAKLERLGGDCTAFARLEARAGDLYALATPRRQPCGLEYSGQLVRL